jgi:hypothetical protein
MNDKDLDPRGLISEAYRMEDVTEADCRVIFLDWVMGARDRRIGPTEIARLLELHAESAPDHPMTKVLREGMTSISVAPGRKGGSRARR